MHAAETPSAILASTGPRFVWLNRLIKSKRNCKFPCSPIHGKWLFFSRLASACTSPGLRQMLRLKEQSSKRFLS